MWVSFQCKYGGGLVGQFCVQINNICKPDDYGACNGDVAENNLTHPGCFAHAKCKFNDAVKAQQKNTGGRCPPVKRIWDFRSFRSSLYRIEKQYKDSSAETRYRAQQEHSIPILNDLKGCMFLKIPS